MARDIEEFLRRAAERRQQQKGGGKPAPPRPKPPQQRRRQEPIEPEIVEIVEEPRRLKPKPKPLQQKLKKNKPNLREQSVSEHVNTYIDTSDIAEQAELLGDGIADIHNQVEAEVHQHLDHDLTALDDNPSVTDQLPSKIFGKPSQKFAKELREMLGNPKTVGKAIILAEILKRPNF